MEENYTPSPYNRDTVLLLCCLGFLGFAGIHRMYVGKIWSGTLWFISGGIFGIGTIYDLFCIFKERFDDAEERKIVQR